MVKEIKTKAEFDQELQDAGDKTVWVDFTATWCGPCKMIGPKFEAFAVEFPECVFIKVDVDENSETAEAHGVSAMPTFKCFKHGKQVDELVGASEAKLKAMIEKYQ